MILPAHDSFSCEGRFGVGCGGEESMPRFTHACSLKWRNPRKGFSAQCCWLQKRSQSASVSLWTNLIVPTLTSFSVPCNREIKVPFYMAKRRGGKGKLVGFCFFCVRAEPLSQLPCCLQKIAEVCSSKQLFLLAFLPLRAKLVLKVVFIHIKRSVWGGGVGGDLFF